MLIGFAPFARATARIAVGLPISLRQLLIRDRFPVRDALQLHSTPFPETASPSWSSARLKRFLFPLKIAVQLRPQRIQSPSFVVGKIGKPKRFLNLLVTDSAILRRSKNSR